MALVVNLTRRRAVEQVLGTVARSIGYLQGGYKDTTFHSSVQLFNTVTQTGRIVYDSGYQRSYTPGVSGNLNGYFSINRSGAFNKFSYIQSSAAASFTLPVVYPSVTASDFNVYTLAWILCSTSNTWAPATGMTSWVKLTLATDTPTNYGNLSASPQSTTRQGAATGKDGIFVHTDYVGLIVLNYANNSVTTNAGNSTLMGSGQQVSCGMCRDDNTAYFVGFAPYNCKISLSGTTITGFSQETSFTYNFGESHSVTSATSGYMMAGYNDTTGRYGNTQHALCQKITFANSSITTLPDLVLAQSSGQMMQGF